MVALSVATLILWCWHFFKKIGITSDFVMGAAIWAIPLGIIVSRLVHVIDKLDYYSSNPLAIFNLAGLTIFGAILGGLLGVWIYCRLHRVPFAPLADLAAPGIILAQAVGRVGCILNGCCYGEPTSSWCAFIYPVSHASHGIPVHPTQLYELLGDLVIFALLFWVFRGRLRPHGSLLALYLVLFSILTFTVRFWRGDTAPFLGPIQEGQLISILVFLVAATWMVVKTRWGQEPDQGPDKTEEPLPGSAE